MSLSPLGRPPEVAVVGGGIAGLAAATLLHARGARVHVYEKSARIGGNAATREVVVDGRARVVDLGVSDFDATSYERIREAADALGVRTGAMDPSTGFSATSGEGAFVLGREGAPAPRALAAHLARFAREAPEVLDRRELWSWTVDRYLAERGYPAEFAERFLHPRITALWFSHEGHPGEMPLRALMRFCQLQEGARPGLPPRPDRRYFVDGARSLAAGLAARLPSVSLGSAVRVHLGGSRPTLVLGDALRPVDAVVFAVHAEDVARIVVGGLPPEIEGVIGAFRYTPATAWVHRDAGVLPRDRRAWGSFNARVRPPEALRSGRPYTVTMCVDRHRGALGPPGDLFVTVNPDRPLAEERLVRDAGGEPVTARFRHNVVDLAALAAQPRLSAVQGRNGAWFCGGYAHGVGLMEDCWRSAETAVDGLLSRFGQRDARVAG